MVSLLAEVAGWLSFPYLEQAHSSTPDHRPNLPNAASFGLIVVVWPQLLSTIRPTIETRACPLMGRCSPIRFSRWAELVCGFTILREGARTLVQEGETLTPVWTPDGKALTFSLQTVSDGFSIYSKAADGTGDARQVVKGGDAGDPSWSPDGRVLFYQKMPATGGTNRDIWSLSDEGEATPLVTGEARLTLPRVSPNGRWIAYESDASGQSEVYVAPIPEADRRFTIFHRWWPLSGMVTRRA